MDLLWLGTRSSPPKLEDASHCHNDDNQSSCGGRNEKYDRRWRFPMEPQKIDRRVLRVLGNENDKQNEDEGGYHHRSPARADARLSDV